MSFPLLAAQGRVIIEEPVYDEYEGLELVEALIRDTRLSEAKGLLHQEESSRPPSLFLLRLKADLAKAEENWSQAATSYREILERLPRTGEVLLRNRAYESLAEVEFRRQNAKACAESFALVQGKLSENSQLLRSRCEFQIGLWEKAWLSLQQFPDGPTKDREMLQRYLDMGLFHAAENFVWRRLLNSKSETEHLTLAEILLSHGANEESLRILEMARTRFPLSDEVLVAWAQLAHQKGLAFATAEAFAQASSRNPKYHFHAAELFRQIGRSERSLFHSVQIRDPEQKLKHKVALAVDRGRFEEIASLAGPISRSKLNEDEEIRYAVAFSLVRRGAHQDAEKWLGRISSPAFLPKATALRESLEKMKPL